MPPRRNSRSSRSERDVHCPGLDEVPKSDWPGNTLNSTERSFARAENSSISPGAACSANAARCGDPQQPATVRGLGHLDRGLPLQTQDFDRATRQPEAAGCEGQTRSGPGEQRVVELLAQLCHVHRNARVGDTQFLGCRADGAESHHGRVGPAEAGVTNRAYVGSLCATCLPTCSRSGAQRWHRRCRHGGADVSVRATAPGRLDGRRPRWCGQRIGVGRLRRGRRL